MSQVWPTGNSCLGRLISREECKGGGTLKAIWSTSHLNYCQSLLTHLSWLCSPSFQSLFTIASDSRWVWIPPPPSRKPCVSSPTHMEANESSLRAFCLQGLPPSSSPALTYHYPCQPLPIPPSLETPLSLNFPEFLWAFVWLTLSFLFLAHSDVFSSRNTFHNQCQNPDRLSFRCLSILPQSTSHSSVSALITTNYMPYLQLCLQWATRRQEICLIQCDME